MRLGLALTAITLLMPHTATHRPATPTSWAVTAGDRAAADQVLVQAFDYIGHLPLQSPPVAPRATQTPVDVTPPGSRPGAPTPISSHRCGGTIGALIESVFGPAGPWAESIAFRESTCVPTAYNSSSAAGLFQIKVPMHAAQFAAAGCAWQQWANATCNIHAAKVLYDEEGTSPWAL